MDNLSSRVKRQATTQLDSQKGRATDGLEVLARAIRQATGQLRSDDHETIAQYMDDAAAQLERLSGTLRNKSVTDLFDDAQRVARRRPALVVGGSFAAGLLAARFLKSSNRERQFGQPAGSSTQTRSAYEPPGNTESASGIRQLERSEPVARAQGGAQQTTPPAPRAGAPQEGGRY